MSSYIEFNDKVAFHPGYYIKEIIDDSGLTQADFAKRLGTTPKNISDLVRGEQSLSVDIANKLSRMLGTSIGYWLGLQQSYDELTAEFMRLDELEKERDVFRMIDYGYFCKYFSFPRLPRKIDEQIDRVRKFLSVASLAVLEKRDLAVDYRLYSGSLPVSSIVNSNILLQIGINQALSEEMPKYDKKKFERCLEYVLSLTRKHGSFIPAVKDTLKDAGVFLSVLPEIRGSGISGATKKVNGKVLILINERTHYEDAFWFTLFHEIGHVMDGSLGATVGKESAADSYAQRMLIPEDKYHDFIIQYKRFDESCIRKFADENDCDAGIVLGRLLVEHKVPAKDKVMINRLRHPMRL